MLLSNGKAPSAIESKDMTGVLRDMYMLEFLDLPEPYKEYDLKKAILKNMKKFLLDLEEILFSLMKNIMSKWEIMITM
mgnify:CR=1 FL=1